MDKILSDDDRQAVFESLPFGLDGFLKHWGWLHFSKATEAAVLAKLREREQEQEPVAYGWRGADGQIRDCIALDTHATQEGEYTIPLYAAPLPAVVQVPQEWRETIQGAIDELPYRHHLIPRLTAMLAAAPEAPAQANPAPGYCKQCKGYTIEEPLHPQTIPAAWVEAVKVAREALEEIADDYADRFDLDSLSTNPGIKSTIKQARAALAQLDALGGGE